MSSVAHETPQVDRKVAASSDQLALFHRTLAEMCRSDLPLAKAFEILNADLDSGPLKDALQQMTTDLDAGMPLDDAYARHEAQFPPLYRTLVRAGMRSGDLAAALEEIASHAAIEADINGRIRKACFLPTISAVFVLLAGLMLFIFAAPRLTQLTALANDYGRATISPLQFRMIGAAIGLGGMGVLFAVVRGFMVLRGPLDRTRRGGAMRFRVPGLGRLRLYAALSSLAATLALLVRRRIPLTEALDLTAEATSDPTLRQHILTMSNSAADGNGLAESIASGGIFAPSLMWLLESAEQRGEGEQALADIAQIYRSRLDRAVDRFTTLVGPLLEIVVGITVLLLAVSFLAPLLEVFELTKKLSTR